MKRVTGLGGIFFKAQDPDKLRAWYHEHLGIEFGDDTAWIFKWREHDQPARIGMTVWAPFPHDTKYFDPSSKPFMINYRVANLDALLAQLLHEGVQVEDRIEELKYGRFAWISDPEGNRIELWEPPKDSE